MKPDKIFYQQSFIHPIYGTYLPTKIGIEVLLNDCDEPDEALAYAKKTVEEWFKKTNPDVIVDSTIPPGPPKELPVINKEEERLEILIDNATTLKELKSFEKEALFVSQRLSDLYLDKMKKLTTK